MSSCTRFEIQSRSEREPDLVKVVRPEVERSAVDCSGVTGGRWSSGCVRPALAAPRSRRDSVSHDGLWTASRQAATAELPGDRSPRSSNHDSRSTGCDARHRAYRRTVLHHTAHPDPLPEAMASITSAIVPSEQHRTVHSASVPPWMQQFLQPLQFRRVGEDTVGDLGAIHMAVGIEDLVPTTRRWSSEPSRRPASPSP